MPQVDHFSALKSSTESIDTEFKLVRGGMPGSSGESYPAMANTQGGTIGLGVAEQRTGLVWKGVPDFAQLRTGGRSAAPGGALAALRKKATTALRTKLIALRREGAASRTGGNFGHRDGLGESVVAKPNCY